MQNHKEMKYDMEPDIPPEINDYGDFAAVGFDEKNVRKAFISKVYAILSVQLLVTLSFVLITTFVEPVHIFMKKNMVLYWIALAVFFVTYIALVCCESIRRQYPANFIALTVFTVAFSYLAATMAVYYSATSVISCIGITAGTTILVSFVAISCPCDITKCQVVLCLSSIVVMVFGLVCSIIYMTMGYNSTLHTVYGGVSALLFTTYLAFDTQMIMGDREYQLSPEDYIYGALQLYMDIMNMFMAFLSIFGSSK